jgi:hypothetical protein
MSDAQQLKEIGAWPHEITFALTYAPGTKLACQSVFLPDLGSLQPASQHKLDLREELI